jgi:hypothetical protein
MLKVEPHIPATGKESRWLTLYYGNNFFLFAVFKVTAYEDFGIGRLKYISNVPQEHVILIHEPVVTYETAFRKKLKWFIELSNDCIWSLNVVDWKYNEIDFEWSFSDPSIATLFKLMYG